MTPRWHKWWRLLALSVDVVALGAALGGAALLRFGPAGTVDLALPGTTSLSAPWLYAVVIWIGAMQLFGLYSPVRCANGVEEARRIMSACFTAPTVLVLGSFLLKDAPSRLWLASGTFAAVVTTGAGRRVVRWATARIRHGGHWTTPAVIVGGFEAKVLVDTIADDPTWGVVPVATCGFKWGDLAQFEVHEIEQAVSATGAGCVAIVVGSMRRGAVQASIAVADDLHITTLVVPGLDYALLHNLQLVALGHEPALALERPSLRPHQRALKRAMDVGVSFLGLAVSSPLLLLLALAIKLDSRGRVLYVQRRVGQRGEEFDVYKFRTMVEGAHAMRAELGDYNESDGALFKIKDDPRVTRVGKLLRKYSFDELPQLWNVLRGEMSLVGPRPALPEEVQEYELGLTKRLAVRPGITGLWQVSGRSELSFDDYVRLDLTYVQNWSILLDIYVLLRTIPSVLRPRGAY